MLAFLDSFCQVLCARDGDAIHRALRHPLAGVLPAGVRSEALAIARAGSRGHLAPTRTFHFYYQTLQLLAPVERGVFMPFEFRRPGPSSVPALAGIR